MELAFLAGMAGLGLVAGWAVARMMAERSWEHLHPCGHPRGKGGL